MQIIPTILEKQFDRAEEKIKLIKDDSKWIQVDVIDGIFTSGRTFELELLNKMEINIDNNLLEIHLMVKEPIKWIEKCSFVNACRVIGQVEMMENVEEFVTEAKNAGIEAGLGFDLETPIKDIPEETDLILLMGRKAGFEPQQLNDKIFEKIKSLVEIKKSKGLRFEIGIDGGINENNILKLKESGIDIAYCGNSIFNGLVKENLKNLYDKIN